MSIKQKHHENYEKLVRRQKLHKIYDACVDNNLKKVKKIIAENPDIKNIHADDNYIFMKAYTSENLATTKWIVGNFCTYTDIKILDNKPINAVLNLHSITEPDKIFYVKNQKYNKIYNALCPIILRNKKNMNKKVNKYTTV